MAPAGCVEGADARPGGDRDVPSASVEAAAEPAPRTAPEWAPGAAVGAVVYVPVYSHIFHQDGSREVDLAATLSARNTDPERALTVASVAYYDSGGRPVREHLSGPTALGPLDTRSFVVEERDRMGGVGANFLVSWSAEVAVSKPVVEAVTISTAS